MTRTQFLRAILATAAVVAMARTGLAQKDTNKTKPKTDPRKANLLQADRLAFTVDAELLASQPDTIGITVGPADPVLRAHLKLDAGQGVVVTRVLPNSRAAKAGVRQHDILLTLDGAKVKTARDILLLSTAKKEKPLSVNLLRAARHLKLTIAPPPKKVNTLKTAKGTWLAARNYWVTASPWRYEIGVGTASADPSLIAQLVLPPSTGLVVRSVKAKSPAAKAGIQKYDVILKAADKYLAKPDDLRKAIDKAATKPLKIEFLRAGRKQTCTIAPAKLAHRHAIYFYDLQRPYVQWQSSLINAPVDRLRGYRRITAKTDTQKQIADLSKRIGELTKALERLQKTLATQHKKK